MGRPAKQRPPGMPPAPTPVSRRRGRPGRLLQTTGPARRGRFHSAADARHPPWRGRPLSPARAGRRCASRRNPFTLCGRGIPLHAPSDQAAAQLTPRAARCDSGPVGASVSSGAAGSGDLHGEPLGQRPLRPEAGPTRPRATLRRRRDPTSRRARASAPPGRRESRRARFRDGSAPSRRQGPSDGVT